MPGRFAPTPVAVSALAGGALGLVLLHPTAAIAIHWGDGHPLIEVLAMAFAPASAPILAYHVLVGALVGWGAGALGSRAYRRRLEAQERAMKLETQLARAQRLESIGRLAAGVAHDFNNLLTALSMNLHLAKETLPRESPAREFVDDAEAVTERAAHLPRQLLSFARRQTAEPKVVSPNDLVLGMGKLVRKVLGDEVELATRLASVPPVRIDPGHFEQVLMNLCVNARDAMPRGGRITIATAVRDVGAGGVPGAESLPPGAYVAMSVADTGTGIPPDVLERIFEPFFTTKEEGKGTGLGLATSHGLANQAGGALTVESEVGVGSTFTLWLPAAAVDPLASPAETAPDAPTPARTTARILLAEDRPDVRRAVAVSLRGRGFDVVEAEDGAQALEVLAATRVDLILTDVAMPRMNGPDLAKEARRRHGPHRVLYMTGETGESLARRGLEDGARVLPKPFTPDALESAVREALEGPALAAA